MKITTALEYNSKQSVVHYFLQAYGSLIENAVKIVHLSDTKYTSAERFIIYSFGNPENLGCRAKNTAGKTTQSIVHDKNLFRMETLCIPF
jgi:hypothetical protein